MSLFLKLKESIWKDHFDSGWRPIGSKLPTLVELSEQYQVSPTTISRITAMFSGEGWLRSRKGSGIYIADTIANRPGGGSIMGRRLCKIGYIASEVDVALAHKSLCGVEHVVRQNNAALEVANSGYKVEQERAQIAAMIQRGVDGIVLYPIPMRQKQPTEFLATEFRDFPIIVIDLYEPVMKRPHVLFDNFSAGREMTRYLINHGHQEIAFLRLDVHPHRSVDDRVKGYHRALIEHGLKFKPELVINFELLPPEFGPLRYLDCLKNIIHQTPRPTAAIVFSDMVVPDFIVCLEELGVSVPNEMEMVGFDNLSHDCRNDWPTTNPDFIAMGERAAEIVFEYIEDCGHNNKLTTETRMIMPCPIQLHCLRWTGRQGKSVHQAAWKPSGTIPKAEAIS